MLKLTLHAHSRILNTSLHKRLGLEGGHKSWNGGLGRGGGGELRKRRGGGLCPSEIAENFDKGSRSTIRLAAGWRPPGGKCPEGRE